MMHQQDIGIAIAGQAQGRAGAHRDDPNGNSRCRLEFRQDVIKQTGILCRRGRGQCDEWRPRCRRRRRRRAADEAEHDRYGGQNSQRFLPGIH